VVTDPHTHPQTDTIDYNTLRRSLARSVIIKFLRKKLGGVFEFRCYLSEDEWKGLLTVALLKLICSQQVFTILA